MQPDEVTQELLDAFNDADFAGTGSSDWEDSHLRIGIAAVLSAPGARSVVLANTKVTFEEGREWVWVYVGEQRVTRVRAADEQTVNALVDVLEALGVRAEREAA